MILPLSDSPRPPGVPWATWGLIAANVALYLLVTLPLSQQGVGPDDPLLQPYLDFLARAGGAPVAWQRLSAYDLFLFRHAYHVGQGSVSTLLSSMFLHGGLMHLGGNMLILQIFGDNVELYVGWRRYLSIYFFTGIVATLAFAALAPKGVTLVGASGAISGVLGCYFVWFPNHQVRLLWAFILLTTFEVRARTVLWMYLLYENVLPLLLGPRGGNVAYGAHIGGFLAGILAARRLRPRPVAVDGSAGYRRSTSSPFFSATSTAAKQAFFGARPAAGRVGGWEVVQKLLAAQSPAAAAAAYAALPPATAAQLPGAATLELADWLTEAQRSAEALGVLRAFIAAQRGRGATGSAMHLAQVHLRAGFLQLRVLHQPAAAQLHFLAVMQLQPPWQLLQAAQSALQEIAAKP